ncbi:MAG: hypothetical protein IJV14_07065 [Lachnospiraceae bacterium]|nr:hypothetical protein [Lachnospiraceae bacterium]
MLQFQERSRMGGDKFHTGGSPLTFSENSIDLVLTEGEVREGSFTIFGHEDESISGFVSSSRVVMQCLTKEFSGSHEVISYRFNGTPFSAGDTVDGYFRIISDHGEYQLPFSVKVMPVPVTSSLGPIRNLYHFTNLAKTSWREALDVFYRPGFLNVFGAADGKDLRLYRGLSARASNEQNMEEFLIATGKKQAVQYLPDQKEISLDLPAPEKESIPIKLTIRRSGWGYTQLHVLSESSFVTVSKNTLSAEDFRDGRAELTLNIEPARLHQGKNLGMIRLLAPCSETRIPVSVRYCVSTALKDLHRKEHRQIIFRMMQCYVDFRTRRLSGREFIQRMEQMIRRLTEIDRNDPLHTLYKIHYLLTARKNEDALWELQALVRRLSGGIDNLPTFSIAHFEEEEDVIYCYRMYLTILCAQVSEKDPIDIYSVTQDATRGIEDALKKDPSNWWIAWLLMYASDAFRVEPEAAFRMLEQEYRFGVRSPLLYLEGWQLISQNPAILLELTPYVLQTLLYASRKNILTAAVMTQIVTLAKREKRFSSKLFEVLRAGYAMEEEGPVQDETLEAICLLLIRGNLTDPGYFTWYQKGVDRQLQVTRLFEYYMLSLPEDFDGEIPQMVTRYFAYQSTLPYERNAYLYRYLAEHRQAFPALYEQYESQIESFVPDQLMHHRMNTDLAWLYSQYLTSGRVLSSEMASAAVPAAFTAMVRTTDRNVKRIVLIYDRLKNEQYYPVTNGTAYLPVYGEDNQIFFEDNNGNRYAVSVPYTCDRMMDYAALAPALAIYNTNNAGFDLYLSGLRDQPRGAAAQAAGPETGAAGIAGIAGAAGTAGATGAAGSTGTSVCGINEHNAPNYLRLASSSDLLPKEKAKLRSRLLAYYQDTDNTRQMDALLMQLDPAGMDAPARAHAIEYMVARGLYEEALGWVRDFSSFHVDGNTLVRLCSQFLDEEKAADDPVFAEIVHETFLKGKYNQGLLEYMGSFFDGTTAELEAIREAAAGFGAEDYVLCRRILIQMLYTGTSIPERDVVIDRYIEQGADEELLTDILAQSCHFYFVDGQKMDARHFDRITRYGMDGVPITDICRIAWLKDLSEKKGEISDTQMEVAGLFLADLLAQNIRFPFFRQFIGMFPGLQPYADETLVEYRAKQTCSGLKVVYHYAMEKNGAREKYESVEMTRMYENVYVTGFLLFFGEQMHYYITDDEEEKNVVESGTVGQDARIPQETDDRFGIINRISMLTALGRDEEAMDRIEKYVHRAYLAQKLFEE